jgi:hypothetical protein
MGTERASRAAAEAGPADDRSDATRCAVERIARRARPSMR